MESKGLPKFGDKIPQELSASIGTIFLRFHFGFSGRPGSPAVLQGPEALVGLLVWPPWFEWAQRFHVTHAIP